MESFGKFRNQLATGAVAIVLALAAYIFNATAATVQQNTKDINDLKLIVIELKTIVSAQQDLNEWFVTEHIPSNRQPNP